MRDGPGLSWAVGLIDVATYLHWMIRMLCNGSWFVDRLRGRMPVKCKVWWVCFADRGALLTWLTSPRHPTETVQPVAGINFCKNHGEAYSGHEPTVSLHILHGKYGSYLGIIGNDVISSYSHAASRTEQYKQYTVVEMDASAE